MARRTHLQSKFKAESNPNSRFHHLQMEQKEEHSEVKINQCLSQMKKMMNHKKSIQKRLMTPGHKFQKMHLSEINNS